MSDPLWPHGLQHARLPCPSLFPRSCSNSCPSSQWCHPTISSSVAPSPPAFALSQHQDLFQGVCSSHQVPKYWICSFSISPSNEYSGLISFRIHWFDCHTVQGTLKSLFQHLSWKASILWCSAFFTVQLSHPYMTTGKSVSLSRWTFDGKIMILVFFLMFSLKPSFSLFFTFIKRLFIKVLVAFCHKGGVICISEVNDISPDHLDSSFFFIQSSISHDVLWM